MTYLIYILYIAGAVLLALGVWRVVVGERRQAYALVIAAMVATIVGTTLSWRHLDGEINALGYARVKAAAAQSTDADAMAQWALGDNRITLSEYAVIAEAHRNQTGKDINGEKAK